MKPPATNFLISASTTHRIRSMHSQIFFLCFSMSVYATASIASLLIFSSNDNDGKGKCAAKILY